MAKIISIKDDCIIIGFPDGSCKTVNRSDLNFFPNVGDEVETYTYNNFLIEWDEMRKKHYNDEITDEEFEEWKLSYPKKSRFLK